MTREEIREAHIDLERRIQPAEVQLHASPEFRTLDDLKNELSELQAICSHPRTSGGSCDYEICDDCGKVVGVS